MIAGKGPVQMQAQADQAEVAAKNLVNVQSSGGYTLLDSSEETPGTFAVTIPPRRRAASS